MIAEPSHLGDHPALRNLFPGIQDEQLEKIKETFQGYLGTLWRIYERLQREQPDIFDSNVDTP